MKIDFSQDFEKMWRCTCGGSHFFCVSGLDYDDEYNVYVKVEEYPMGGHWERIKAAFKLVFKRRHRWIELQLSKQSAEEIAAELLKNASKIKHR